MSGDESVQNGGLVSDEALREWLGQEIHRCLHIEKRKTREELASDSRVNVWTIDAIRAREGPKRRELTPAVLLSLCHAMGERAVNGLLARIGYGGAAPLGEGDELQVNAIVAKGLQQFTIIAAAGADGRIDHHERPACEEAADELIATVLPLSSAKRRRG